MWDQCCYNLSIYLYVCPSICPYINLADCLSVCPSKIDENLKHSPNLSWVLCLFFSVGHFILCYDVYWQYLRHIVGLSFCISIWWFLCWSLIGFCENYWTFSLSLNQGVGAESHNKSSPFRNYYTIVNMFFSLKYIVDLNMAQKWWGVKEELQENKSIQAGAELFQAQVKLDLLSKQ